LTGHNFLVVLLNNFIVRVIFVHDAPDARAIFALWAYSKRLGMPSLEFHHPQDLCGPPP